MTFLQVLLTRVKNKIPDIDNNFLSALKRNPNVQNNAKALYYKWRIQKASRRMFFGCP